MSASYNGERGTQRQRREILCDIREHLGDRLFADFMIDAITGYGRGIAICELPALVDVWLLKQRFAA